MSRLIIGSSNVYRNYVASKFRKYGEFTMIRCTDIDSFSANMAGLEESDEEIIVSVIENFVEKAGRGIDDPDKKERSIEEAMDRYIKIIKEAASRLSKSRMVIIEPILRPSVDWYEASYDDIRKYVSDGVKKLNLDNTTSIVAISRASQSFTRDGFHLTEAAGEIFLEGVLSQAKSFFGAKTYTLDDDEDDEEAEDRTRGGASGSGARKDDVSRKLQLLEDKTRARRSNDDLLFARVREELTRCPTRTRKIGW